MSFRVLLVVVTLIALATTFTFSLPKDYLYTSSARAGIEWLISYPAPYENAGVLWVLHDIHTHHCPYDSLGKALKERYLLEPQTKANAFYFAFRTGALPSEVDVSQLAQYDRWLISALRCTTVSLDESTTQELIDDRHTAYDLTHQYIALTYLERLGCVTSIPAALDTLRTLVAKRIADEDMQDSHVFSDLSAERAALLLWGGHASLVSTEWLERIAHAQQPSGGWKDAPSDTAPNPHTTALATWALIQYLDECPLDKLYFES